MLHVKLVNWFEVDTRPGLFIRIWPFGQVHWSRLGLYADRWATLKATAEVG
jgi:hypothetical protein